MRIKAKDINENITWKDLTLACNIYEGGASKLVNTGDWRTMMPVLNMEKCKQCLLCVPVCPDMAIPVDADGKRDDFDYYYCKGCGICYKACPFGAIDFIKEEK